MHFKHPEILYAALLVIIPIVIHLFQFNRFKKTLFTNVALLQKINFETRHSSRLKKWLLLCTRVLAFLALIIAFAQPYFSNFEKGTQHHLIVYLDNSWSMSAMGQRGELLIKSSDEILEHINLQHSKMTLITNDQVYPITHQNELENVLHTLEYTEKKANFQTLSLQLQNELKNNRNTSCKIVLISDFQDIDNSLLSFENTTTHFIKPYSRTENNIFIDSIFIKEKSATEITLNAIAKSNQTTEELFPISLFDDAKLIGKSVLKFDQSQTATAEFKFKIKDVFLGKLEIDDPHLTFDNTSFFVVSKPPKINVLSIEKSPSFVDRIFTSEEFIFSSISQNRVNLNTIANNDLVILNELPQIASPLATSLANFLKKGGDVVLIPATNPQLDSYNRFLGMTSGTSYTSPVKDSAFISNIHYTHPFFKDVFEKQIDNFNYPHTLSYFKQSTASSNALIRFENNVPFLSLHPVNTGRLYTFNAPLNTQNSNFQTSLLIAPLFYNFAIYSYQLPQLYYTMGEENTVTLKQSMIGDDIVRAVSEDYNFIPQQMSNSKTTCLTFNDTPHTNGFIRVFHKTDTLTTLAFNHSKTESILNNDVTLQELVPETTNVLLSDTIKDVFHEINTQKEIHSYFKWFLTLGIVFLLLEIGILKFV